MALAARACTGGNKIKKYNVFVLSVTVLEAHALCVCVGGK